MNTASGSPSGVICIMDSSGHQELTWHLDKGDEIANARAAFERFLTQGYTAFGALTRTQPKHVIKAFDPQMEEVIMVPRIVGG